MIRNIGDRDLRAGGQEKQLKTNGFFAYPTLWLSPNGRYLVVETLLNGRPPAIWSKYKNLASLSEIGDKSHGIEATARITGSSDHPRFFSTS